MLKFSLTFFFGDFKLKLRFTRYSGLTVTFPCKLIWGCFSPSRWWVTLWKVVGHLGGGVWLAWVGLAVCPFEGSAYHCLYLALYFLPTLM